jgi:SAM-dependent methyltransferase
MNKMDIKRCGGDMFYFHFMFAVMEPPLDQNFWNERYRSGNTGWDLGAVSPVFLPLIQQLTNHQIAILIPGAGNAYEAEYLADQGFQDITVLDISEEVCERLRTKWTDKACMKVLCTDFFNHQGQYDLILDQTCLCAIDPALRPQYAAHMFQLLNPNGLLSGVLFNKDFEGGPPFGGNPEEYMAYFKPYFKMEIWEPCLNSVAPRAGAEWSIGLRKPA